jgi:hypothetical protein
VTALFVDVPDLSISYIYQSTGCQHSLQPTADDYEVPSIPALTLRGFARWQSIELLLGPEEHVPFLQFALKNFGIKHPETGELFPANLPTESLPSKPDPQIERWHNHCAEKLREAATPKEDDHPTHRPELPPRPKPPHHFSYVRRSEPLRSEKFKPEVKDCFTSKSTSPGDGPGRPRASKQPSVSRSPSQHIPSSPGEFPRGSRPRRRSLPDESFSASSPNLPMPSPNINLKPEKDHTRRHSHPRQYRRPSISSLSSESEEDSMHVNPSTTPQSRRKSHPNTLNPRHPSVRLQVPHSSMPSSPLSPRRSHQNSPRPSPRESPRNSPHPFRSSSGPDRGPDPRRPPVSVDVNGSLSAPFIRPENRGQRPLRSNSRGTNVRWTPLDEVAEFPKRSRRGSADTSATDDHSPPRRWHSHRERRREPDQDRGTGIGRPRFVQGRRGSHEDRTRDFREGDRGRDSASDIESKRKRKSRVVSPVVGVDGRKYPPA